MTTSYLTLRHAIFIFLSRYGVKILILQNWHGYGMSDTCQGSVGVPYVLDADSFVLHEANNYCAAGWHPSRQR